MGVERVRDVDVMPINPTENLPASFIESHPHIIMNGHVMVEGQPVHHHRGALRDGPPARGPAAGRAQQEARAAAAAAQAVSQESDMHTLSEVRTSPWHLYAALATSLVCPEGLKQTRVDLHKVPHERPGCNRQRSVRLDFAVKRHVSL